VLVKGLSLKKQIETMATLNEILDSDLINNLIAEDDKALADAGWTYAEIKEIARLITK
tara:strand:+ start:299 stop:472 length:174 start_codon:yes stop_codon:yes gene_type:complete